MFTQVLDMLDAIGAERSTTKKKTLIKEFSNNPLFVQVVHYALDPYKMFNMTGTIQVQPVESNIHADVALVFSMLDDFSKAQGLTNQQKDKLSLVVQVLGSDACAVVNRVLNKDLRCGAQIALFKSAAPDVYETLTEHHPTKGLSDVPTFLAHMRKKGAIIYGSAKLDGTRCWAVCDINNETVTYLSFNGKQFTNFNCFDYDLLLAAAGLAYNLHADFGVMLSTIIFDGEVENVAGDFQQLMSDFRRLNDVDSSGFRFRIFDWVPPRNDQLCHLPYYLRDDHLAVVLDDYDPSCDCGDPRVSRLAVFEIAIDTATEQKIEALRDTYIDEYGKEGLMLKDSTAPYEHKKGKTWCKVKRFDTLDLPVIGIEEGTGKNAGMLGALLCEYRGKQVKVGSGYNDEQRAQFWTNPPKCIEVKYQEETKAGSLRFPVFVRRRDDKAGIK